MIAEPRPAKAPRTKPHPIPGAFLVFADEFYVSGEAEEFHRFETAEIHLLGNSQHCAGSHTQSPEAQLPIAQGRVDDANLVIHEILEGYFR
jgi:hypothetical protein